MKQSIRLGNIEYENESLRKLEKGQYIEFSYFVF